LKTTAEKGPLLTRLGGHVLATLKMTTMRTNAMSHPELMTVRAFG